MLTSKKKKHFFECFLLVRICKCYQNKQLKTKMSFGAKNPFKDGEIGNEKIGE